MNTVKNQILAAKQNKSGGAPLIEVSKNGNGSNKSYNIDPSVMRSVVVNFHKKPLEERLNEVINQS